MNRRRSIVIATISALLAAGLVFVIYQLQLKQLELEAKVAVIVPAQLIDAGTMIERDMLKVIYISRSGYRTGMIQNVDELVGLETLIPLGHEEPILRWKVSQFHLLPNANEYTFQIPKSYVLSISNDVRAGDQVRLYISGSGGSKLLLDRDITVASVKTASNTEVDNSKHPELLATAQGDQAKLYMYRRNATGAIEHVNLNLSEQEWLLIDEQCRNGVGKLVIAFASSYWGNEIEGAGESR